MPLSQDQKSTRSRAISSTASICSSAIPVTKQNATTDESRAGLVTPRFSTIARWCDLSGMSRTGTYREIGNGNLIAKKLGKRTLIDVQAGLAWLAALPSADIRNAA